MEDQIDQLADKIIGAAAKKRDCVRLVSKPQTKETMIWKMNLWCVWAMSKLVNMLDIWLESPGERDQAKRLFADRLTRIINDKVVQRHGIYRLIG